MSSATDIIAPREQALARAYARVAGLPRAYPYTTLVLALGLAARAVLAPITHGQDFVVWDLASRATLAGVNIYAHHPHYPGGPYTYLPLFLYTELPLQWLALHLGWSFTVLGKLPILAGDLLATVLIGDYLARRGHGDGAMALGAALYFLNPLVLYNGAFYGRFDAFCVGLFLLALRFHEPARPRSWRFPLLYALAVAAKTYPVFILPWLLRREPESRVRILAVLAAVLGGLSLPYLLTSPARLIADVILYNGNKLPGNLSWQIILLQSGVLTPQSARVLSWILLALFAAALALFTRLDLYTYCSVAILLFLVFSKVLIEQYFLWPMPFLIVAAVHHRSWASWGLLALLSAAGTLINPFIHPLPGGERVVAANVLVAVCITAYAVTRRPAPDAAAP